MLSKLFSSFKIAFLILVLFSLSACDWFKSKPRNVILIIMDTTRADHLGLYGYERNTSPNLDQFAKEALVFDHAVATAPWTPPSIATIMSGLYPVTHGLMPPGNRVSAKKSSKRLDDSITTLAEVLKSKGYRTGGATPNPWTSKLFGFDQGFDQYDYHERANADEMTQAGIKILDSWKGSDQPFFLFLHYLDPHYKYEPPAPYDTRFTGWLVSRKYDEEAQNDLNLYDGEIANMDHQIGEFFKVLKERGLYDDSLIVIVSDHGEQLKERGHTGHGFQLFEEEVHTALMIHDRDKTGRVDYTVSNLDVFPTIMDVLGIKDGPKIQGISLFDEEKLLQRPGVLMEIDRIWNLRGFVSLEGKKLMLNFRDEDDLQHPEQIKTMGVFNPRADPFELTPIVDQALQSNLRKQFDLTFKTALANKINATSVDINEDTLKQLRSLGYMK
jgi:arylsulfatase A-like enzyme